MISLISALLAVTACATAATATTNPFLVMGNVSANASLSKEPPKEPSKEPLKEPSKETCVAKHMRCRGDESEFELNDLDGGHRCCEGTNCTMQWTCPSGVPPRPGSKCGTDIPVKDCFTCEEPMPPPLPAGCVKNVGGKCDVALNQLCCVSDERCSTFLHCLNKKCVYFPPP